MPIKFLSSKDQVKGCTRIQAEPTEVNFGALILHVYNKGTNMLNNNIKWLTSIGLSHGKEYMLSQWLLYKNSGPNLSHLC